MLDGLNDPAASLLGQGEVRTAVEALKRAPDRSLAGLRDALLRTLENRGFTTRPPAALDASLEEIRLIGPGFDLYDLCQTLARGECAAFPELAPFVKEIP